MSRRVDDKRKGRGVSMNSAEWGMCVRAAEAWSRRHGPRASGHVVSTSAFIRDAALACARVLLLDNLDKPKNHISNLEGDGELNDAMKGLADE